MVFILGESQKKFFLLLTCTSKGIIIEPSKWLCFKKFEQTEYIYYNLPIQRQTARIEETLTPFKLIMQ